MRSYWPGRVAVFPASKECPGCHQEKPRRDYFVDATRKEGMASLCLACQPVTKKCRRCDLIKPAQDFPYDYERLRYGYWCNDCVSTGRRGRPRPTRVKPIGVVKTCSVCHRQKDASEFYGSRHGDGLSSRCKPCTRRHFAKYQTAHHAGDYDLSEREWAAICGRYENRCLACGEKCSLEVDHILPVSRGGTSATCNLQPLCATCNFDKLDGYRDYRQDVLFLDWT